MARQQMDLGSACRMKLQVRSSERCVSITRLWLMQGMTTLHTKRTMRVKQNWWLPKAKKSTNQWEKHKNILWWTVEHAKWRVQIGWIGTSMSIMQESQRWNQGSEDNHGSWYFGLSIILGPKKVVSSSSWQQKVRQATSVAWRWVHQKKKRSWHHCLLATISMLMTTMKVMCQMLSLMQLMLVMKLVWKDLWGVDMKSPYCILTWQYPY